MTSGSSPAAALEVSIWLNWSSATATSSTSTPLSSVKSSTIAWVAATRSGRSSTIQTVMRRRRRRSPSPPSSSEPQAASEAARRAIARSGGRAERGAAVGGHGASVG